MSIRKTVIMLSRYHKASMYIHLGLILVSTLFVREKEAQAADFNFAVGGSYSKVTSGCTGFSVVTGLFSVVQEAGLVYFTSKNVPRTKEEVAGLSISILVFNSAFDVGNIVCLAIGASENVTHTWISAIVALGLSIIPIAHAGYIAGHQDEFYNNSLITQKQPHHLTGLVGTNLDFGVSSIGPRSYGLALRGNF